MKSQTRYRASIADLQAEGAMPSDIGERFEWLLAVGRQKPRSLEQVMVAGVLAKRFNVRRGAAWPSTDTIAEETGMKRQNVWRALKGLESRGFTVRVEMKGCPNAYALRLPASPEIAGRHLPGLQPGISRDAEPASPGMAKQVSRSESVGKPHPGASARVAQRAPRARAGGKAKCRMAPIQIPTRL